MKQTLTVNQRNLEWAIRQAVQPMQTFFDPAKEMLPFFHNLMIGEAKIGNGHHESFSMSHVPGRWLNALLHAEDAVGIHLEEDKIEILQMWVYRSVSDKSIFPLCLSLDTMNPKPYVDLHNLREVMHALTALYRFRNDSKAYRLACRLINGVDLYFDFEHFCFLTEKYKTQTGFTPICCASTKGEPPLAFPLTFGRYIGPLVKFYEATGYPKALDQAIRLKDACLKHLFCTKTGYQSTTFGCHTHSTTSMFSSLAQLARVTGDTDLLLIIQDNMINSLPSISSDFGWCVENDRRSDLIGESNNTADLLEICLILGQAGFPDYYRRSERILMNHLLPSQLMDLSFLAPENNECWRQSGLSKEDYCDLVTRIKGAFGFPLPFGYPNDHVGFNWDVVGGVTSALCEAWRHRVLKEDRLTSIQLLYNYRGDDFQLEDPYGNGGIATIIYHRPVNIRLLLPEHIDRCQIQVRGADYYMDKHWLYIIGDTLEKVNIHLPFTETILTENFHGTRLSYKMQGDKVIAAQTGGAKLSFFLENK